MTRHATAEHPCRPCGACCASLRVSFHEHELADLGVPQELTEPRSPHHLAMRRVAGRCVAFEGTVGSATRCRIYAHRPSPCRAFAPSWESGEANRYCDESRTARGLPLLTPADWRLQLFSR